MNDMLLWIEQFVIERFDDECIGGLGGKDKFFDTIDWQKLVESYLSIEIAESFGGEQYPGLELPSVDVNDEPLRVETFVFGFGCFLRGCLLDGRFFVFLEGLFANDYCVFLDDVDDVLLAE